MTLSRTPDLLGEEVMTELGEFPSIRGGNFAHITKGNDTTGQKIRYIKGIDRQDYYSDRTTVKSNRKMLLSLNVGINTI